MNYFYPPKPKRIWPNSSIFQNLDNDPNWIGQIKYNGWRLLVFKEHGQIQMYNRHGSIIDINTDPFNDYFKYVPNNSVLDGELVHFRTTDLKNIVVLFDVPMWGKDLRKVPLIERLKYLEDFAPASEDLQSPGVFRILTRGGNFIKLYEDTILKDEGYTEGIVLKKINSVYSSHPLKCLEIVDWIKVKRDENERK